MDFGKAIGRAVTNALARVMTRPGVSSKYGGGNNGVGGLTIPGQTDQGGSWIWGWRPRLSEPVEDTWQAWTMATARVIDQLHNSGWLAGACEQARVQMVGSGLALNAKPDPDLFGSGYAGRRLAHEWSRGVERRHNTWASNPWNCDLGGRYSIGQLESQGVGQAIATGEIVALLPYVMRDGNTHGIKVNLIPSSRLSQTGFGADTRPCVQGVYLGQHGEPVAYALEQIDYGSRRIVQQTVEARNRLGDPALLHMFDNAPGAVRGISCLAPALKTLRQYEQGMDSTLTTFMIQSIFSATIESEEMTPDIMAALQGLDEQIANPDMEASLKAGDFDKYQAARLKWYKGTPGLNLGSYGKVAHMFPGETLKFNRNETPNTNFQIMMSILQREICRCLGITYESGTLNYTGATYTAVKMGGADTWLVNLYRRAWGPARLRHEIYRQWLLEDILRGNTEVPGGIDNFLANRDRFSIAEYRGPAKPTADDLKTAKANQIIQSMGWASGSQIAADYGNDYFDVIDEQQMEEAARSEADLPPTPPLGGGNGGQGGEAGAPGGNGSPTQSPRGDGPDARAPRLLSEAEIRASEREAIEEATRNLILAVRGDDKVVAMQVASELEEYLEAA